MSKTITITVVLSEEQLELLKRESQHTNNDSVEMLMEDIVASKIHHVIEWGSETVSTEFTTVAEVK